MAAQRNPEAFGQSVQHMSTALQIFGGGSPLSPQEEIPPELLRQAVEATGASPASISRLHRFRGVYNLSKEIRDMLEINQRPAAQSRPVAPMAIGAPPVQEEARMADAGPQPTPEPTVEEPVDEEVEKVLESILRNNQAGFSPEEHPDDVLPGYHMNKKHWNTVHCEAGLSKKLLQELIDHSYDLVVESLPKKLKAELEGLE